MRTHGNANSFKQQVFVLGAEDGEETVKSSGCRDRERGI